MLVEKEGKEGKRRSTESAVTNFRRADLNTAAISAKRVFLCEGVVQGWSRSGASTRQCKNSKKAKH